MGVVYLGEEKKWGEYTLAAEGRAVMSTLHPQGVFGTFPKKEALLSHMLKQYL